MSDILICRVARAARARELRRNPGLLAAFILGVLGGTLVTTKTAVAYCVGETLDLIDPVVTVISGPGDPVAEQSLWLTFEDLELVGPDEFHIDGTSAILEGSP